MFASLVRTALLLSGQGGSPADADSLDIFWLLLSASSAIGGALWLLLTFLGRGTKAPQSSRSSRPPAMPTARRPRPVSKPNGTTVTQEPAPPRVIRLHAVTPGQSQHEYNVGDQQGTRGSALAHVA